MKNSIGSLAALTATLAAAPAVLEAAPSHDVKSADFNNVSVSLYSNYLQAVDFDIDGDGTADFAVYGNSGNGIRLQLLAATQLSDGPVTFGTEFFANAATVTLETIIDTGFNGYYGFSFVTGSETHAAWVHFDINQSAPVVVSGGWEAESHYQYITVGDPSPVPEPSAAGLLAGAAALTGAFALRRRRRS